MGTAKRNFRSVSPSLSNNGGLGGMPEYRMQDVTVVGWPVIAWHVPHYPRIAARVCERGHATVVLRRKSAHATAFRMRVKVGRLSLRVVLPHTDNRPARCNPVCTIGSSTLSQGSVVMSEPATPFDTIESAQDFVRVLAETIAEARQEIAADLERELQSPASRRTKALQIAAYNLDRLEKQMLRSRRILNDLRSLRRLLFAEREFHRVKGLSTAPAVASPIDVTPTLVTAIPGPRPIAAVTITAVPTRPAIPA